MVNANWFLLPTAVNCGKKLCAELLKMVTNCKFTVFSSKHFSFLPTVADFTAINLEFYSLGAFTALVMFTALVLLEH